MRLIDTTDATAYQGSKAIFNSSSADRECHLAGRFRIHLLGMYFANTGPEWDSNGRKQSDFLHHIDIPVSGRRQVIHNGVPFELLPGEVWFLPGNTPVERCCSGQCEVVFFKFSSEWLPGVDPLLDWSGRQPRIAARFDTTVWNEWLQGTRPITVADLLQLRGMLLSWMALALPELGEIISKHLETHMQFTTVFDVIERELGADLRLPVLARAHGTSVEAFSMSFARSTGMSPKDYLTRRLNQEALQLVINTDLKMKEIADKLRFNDEFYFSRFFKKLNGSPPSDYRRKLRGN